MGLFDNKTAGFNLPVTYVNSLFDNVKDSSGKAVEKLDTQSFLQMLQTASNNNSNNKEYATQLLQLVCFDIKSGMTNGNTQQQSTDGISSLDADASSYSKADFASLGTLGGYIAKADKNGTPQQTDHIDRMDYLAIMLRRNKKQTDQMLQQLQQSTASMFQNTAAGAAAGPTPSSFGVPSGGTSIGQMPSMLMQQALGQAG